MKKVQFSDAPLVYQIRKVTDKEVFVRLRKNITEKTREDEQGTSTFFEADEIEIVIPKRQEIEKYIENNFDALYLGADVESLSETISSMAVVINALMDEIDALKGGA
jgi:hypothetical protein